jgi:predicted DNA-binding transcriptional regulator AlpA
MPRKRVRLRSSGYRDPAVIAALGISRATFYRRLQDGTLSKPVAKAGKNRRLWTDGDLALARQELKQSQEKVA